ncbi:MAG: hypothetical protein K6T65_09725 [Peptococcaceae bacterium]|nr:hypothetical protein [Peptococcaceae bacterium]
MKKEKTGLAYYGRELVVVVFSQEDFLSLWGGTPDDYKDFLLTREERIRLWMGKNDVCDSEQEYALEPEPEPVTVPFDREDFTAWLAGDPRRANLADPIGQWALAVAQDPLKLSSLCVRHPFFSPFSDVPPDEQLKVAVLVWLFPVEVSDEAFLQELLKPLQCSHLEELRRALIAAGLGSYPSFQRLSRRRARGVTMVPFDRFADPERVLRLEKNMERLFYRGNFNDLPGCFSLPGRYQLRPRPDWRYPRRMVLCLPFIVAGSKVEVSLFYIGCIGDICFGQEQIKVWEEYLLSLGVNYCSCAGHFTFASRAEERCTEMEVSPDEYQDEYQ